MSKPVVLTGLRANNDLHIGNYLGALLPMVDMATQRAGEYQVNLFVPDLHSFTTPIDHSKLQEGIMQNLKVFVAAGLPLDNPDIHIYRQSYVPAHSELAWIFSCFTGFGEMNRMTQFKDKATLSEQKTQELFLEFLRSEYPDIYMMFENVDQIDEETADKLLKAFTGFEKHINAQAKDRSSIGLFTYPVLMAADILLYSAMYIPVGDDQTQHLEFTRDIAERMNNQYGELFAIPKAVKEQHEFFGKDQGLRIRDLVDPTKKMSKSDETGKGVIFLSDSADMARKKIYGATTDSYEDIQHNYNSRPGISNLLDILTLFGGDRSEFVGGRQYGPLKMATADKVAEFLTDFQAKLAHVDERSILEKLTEDEAKMNEVANAKLLEVQKAVGLRQP